MPSLFDQMFTQIDSKSMGYIFGEPVEYTDLAGVPVTDAECYVDFIESGYEVDAGIRQSQPPEGTSRGVEYTSRRTFGLRKSVVADPQIFGVIRVVGEGANADEWTVYRIIGSECDRTYVECERVENHERSHGSMRARG